MSPKHKIGVTLFALFIVAKSLYSSSITTDTLGLMTQINHRAYKERKAAVESLTQSRDEIIQKLIEIVENPETRDDYKGPLYLSIELLGEYRAEEAVRPLARRITYYPTLAIGFIMGSSEMLPQEYYYPSAVALKKIGKPATQILLEDVGVSSDPLQRRLAAWVIMEVEGPELAVYLINKEKKGLKAGSTNDDQLTEAISFIQNYKPIFEPPDTYIKIIEDEFNPFGVPAY